jgi:hypothetical protein
MAKRTPKETRKPTTGEKVKIKHQFTLEETNLLVKELTRKMELVEEQDANVKAAAAVAKAEIKSMKADITEMRNKLSGGYEEREVDALVTFHRKSGMKAYTRHCPGQPGHGDFIKKIEMVEADYQLLPFEEKVGDKVEEVVAAEAEAKQAAQIPRNAEDPSNS